MQNQQPTLNISLDKTTPYVCDSCSNATFAEGTLLRKASKFLTGSPEDSLIPIPVFYCTKCGHVNKEFIPTPLQTTAE